jgi:hypothetical protein
MHDKEEDLLFSKSLFLTVTLLLGCNKEEEDRIGGNRGFCFRPVANPDVQTTFVVAAAVCILESVWLRRDVKEKRNARVLFSCFKTFCEDVCFRKIKGKIVPQTHNILFKPTETLAKNTKKIQKNVPARARYIIRILSAPRNNVVTIQRVSCHPGTPRMLEY